MKSPFISVLVRRPSAAIWLLWVLACCACAPLSAVEYTWKAGEVVATDQGATVWTNRLEPADSTTVNDGRVTALGGQVFAHSAMRLFVLDGATGVVLRMKPLPGKLTDHSFSADGQTLNLTVSGPLPGDKTWSKTYHVTATGDDIEFTFPDSVVALITWRRVADAPLQELMKAAKKTAPSTASYGGAFDPATHPFLEQALPILAAMAKLDPTNPRLPFAQGIYLHELGRETEAQAMFQACLSIDSAYDYQLIGLVQGLDALAPSLADKAFQRGLKSLIDHGFEPEQNGTLITLMAMYGTPWSPTDLDAVKDIDRLNRLGERIWALAPYGEMVHLYYGRLAAANEAAGKPDLAKRWKERALEAAERDEPFLPAGGKIVWTGHAINLWAAVFYALLLTVVLKSLKYMGVMLVPGERGWRRYMLFCYWSKAELLGALLLLIPLTIANTVVMRGVAAVGIGAAQPLSNVNGMVGHPSSVAFWSKYNNTPGGQLCEAVTLQKSGDLAGAETIYGNLQTPAALVNLGLIREAQGKPDEAKAMYEKALSKSPGLPEAMYNLGQTAHSSRVDRHIAAGATGKLMVLPEPQDIVDSFFNPPGAKTVYLPFLDSLDLDSGTSSTGAGAFLFGLVVLVTLMALVALVAPRVQAPAGMKHMPMGRASWLGWGLGWVVPGIGRAWSVFGPTVTAVFVFSLLIFGHLGENNPDMVTNPLEAIVVPNVEAGYGKIANLPPSANPTALLPEPTKFVVSTANWWGILLVINIVVLAVGEKVAPDPVGPFARTDLPPAGADGAGDGGAPPAPSAGTPATPSA